MLHKISWLRGRPTMYYKSYKLPENLLHFWNEWCLNNWNSQQSRKWLGLRLYCRELQSTPIRLPLPDAGKRVSKSAMHCPWQPRRKCYRAENGRKTDDDMVRWWKSSTFYKYAFSPETGLIWELCTLCTVFCPLSRDVLCCFLSQVPVTNWAAQQVQ